MSVYKSYSKEQLDELFSNFLINSWSYSKVSQFSRNEKAFEMIYVYGQSQKSSATTVAGQAYHFALESFFSALKNGEQIDIATLEILAFNYIEDKPAFVWKIQKTTPNIEECRRKAISTVTGLIKNFYSEISTYLDSIKEVVDVEVYCDEFLTINGVDIPLPLHSRIDLIIKTKNDKIAIVDHKSKASFTDEQELKLAIGTQAVTYVKSYQAKNNIQVDEVWFVENKYSKNRDGGPQLNCYKVELNKDTIALYEALLYEPLKRMVSAVNDPDYVYLINESDSYTDRSEVYEFWAKTMVCEIDDFNVDPSKKELVSKRLKKIKDSSITMVNPKVIREFKKNASEFIQYDLSNKNMTQSEKIEHVLRTFGIIVKVSIIFEGYSSNTFLLEISAGVKISSIASHKLDIANALDVSTVRIASDLVVYNDKSYLSIEFSKQRTAILKYNPEDLIGFKIPIGKDNLNNTIVWDLENHSTPHVLICGATGSGKSVSIKCTIEYAILSGVDKIVIFDPKHEFNSYSDKAFVFSDIEDIEIQMEQLVKEMNDLVRGGIKQRTLVVFDEFADAIAQSKTGNELKIYETVATGMFANGNIKTKRECVGEKKSLEENLRILLQKGRSSGFRIMAATQRASTKVITGDSKVNFPVQICYRVPKETDSRVVIDEAGAESLTGMGDGLIKSPQYPTTVRFQAYYHD